MKRFIDILIICSLMFLSFCTGAFAISRQWSLPEVEYFRDKGEDGKEHVFIYAYGILIETNEVPIK
jgi:hypothetical protein